MTHSTRAQLALAVVAAVGLPAGCKSPATYHREADRAANRIVDDKQLQALGRQEPFSIDRPSDQLRRRLLLDQDLPVSGPASYGPQFVPRIPRLPTDAPGGEPIGPMAPVDGDGELAADDGQGGGTPASGGGNSAAIAETPAAPSTTAAAATQPTTATADATTRPAAPPPDAATATAGVRPWRVSLVDSLQIGARNAREFQTRKERVFRSALALDLERDAFRNTFTGLVSGDIVADVSEDETVTGAIVSPSVGVSRRLFNGAQLSTRIGVDLVKLLTQDKSASFGVFADASVTLPLLRGAGTFIVTEPLRQAEREVVYEIWGFEEYKRDFAVTVATNYLSVLEQQDVIRNNEDSYRRQVLSTRRARRLAEAGRLPQVQVDQAISQELRSRDRLNTARATLTRRLDTFKTLIGLPTDAYVELDRADLDRLEDISARILASLGQGDDTGPIPDADQPVEIQGTPFGGASAGRPYELDEQQAIRVALAHRLDLRVAHGEVYDAQRQVVVAANNFLPRLDIRADASWGERRGVGSAGLPDAELRIDEATYAAGADLELPLERTRERNAYRLALIQLDVASRNVQDIEDDVKALVREALRDLRLAKETLQTQARAVAVAQRRVASTTLFLEAGRVQIRDLLESQEALVTARNAFIGALIDYRVAELDLQGAMGVLEVNEQGLWTEFDPSGLPTDGPPARPYDQTTMQQEGPAVQ